MGNSKRNFMTIGQIDATGIRGPHEKELIDIGKSKVNLFKDIDVETLKKFVVKDIGGKIENLDFDEDFTITIEFFPEVNIHFLYTYYGDEFGDYLEAEIKFFFSGERVSWVPGEDLATIIDIVMDFLERRIKGEVPFEKSYDKKTELMKKVLVQRKEPFQFLREEEKRELAMFLGAKVWRVTNGWRIKKEIFPKIFVEIFYDNNQNNLDISYIGDNLEKIGSYHLELIGIFVINHILRYITINNIEKKLPNICFMMFSRFYSKLKNWDLRTP